MRLSPCRQVHKFNPQFSAYCNILTLFLKQTVVFFIVYVQNFIPFEIGI